MPADEAPTSPKLPPADKRYFEDYVVGAVYEAGPIAVDPAELVDFARAYDPQPMHVDADWAATGPFGGLIASGWHTASLIMRLFVDNFVSSVAGLVSPGIDELRWVLPVRPGDALSAKFILLDKRRLTSDPMRGVMKTRVEGYNQHGQLVVHYTASGFIRCRAPEVS